jgi:lipopolysaccharide transport system ATP-binding protein
MHSVAAADNRTVLFVSHNLQAVQSLCDRAILLESGGITMQGASRSVVTRYLVQDQPCNGQRTWSPKVAPGNEDVTLRAVRVLSPKGEAHSSVDSDEDFYIELDFVLQRIVVGLCVGFDLTDSEGVTVFRTYQTDLPQQNWPEAQVGHNRWRCKIPKGLLNGGDFHICPRIGIHNVSWIVHEDAVVQLRMNLRHGVSPLWNSLTEASRPGVIAPVLDWNPVA